MGYRSSVSMVFGSKLAGFAAKMIEEAGDRLKPDNFHTDVWKGDTVTLYEWDWIRWYGPDVEKLMDIIYEPEAIAGDEYDEKKPEWGMRYIRIGEEPGDVDREGNDYGWDKYTVEYNQTIDYDNMFATSEPVKYVLKEWIREHLPEKPLTTESLYRTVWASLDELSPNFRRIKHRLEYHTSADPSPLKKDMDCNYTDIDISPGASEGVYVVWYIFDANLKQRLRVATIKTLDEDVYAYCNMGILTGLLQFASDAYLEVIDEI